MLSWVLRQGFRSWNITGVTWDKSCGKGEWAVHMNLEEEEGWGCPCHRDYWETSRVKLFTWFPFPILSKVQWTVCPHFPRSWSERGWNHCYYPNEAKQSTVGGRQRRWQPNSSRGLDWCLAHFWSPFWWNKESVVWWSQQSRWLTQ